MTLVCALSTVKRRALRFGGIFALLVVVAVSIAAGWLYWASRAALPQLEGSVLLPALTAPVSVVRDVQGVPHISATSLHDLYFTQGYVTAQDRLWQLDITRRFAAGEMAEIFGDSMLRHDREQRILGLRQVARDSFAALPAREQSHLEAYARGVNAYIDARRGALPLEFRLLGYQPRPWQPEEAMLIYAHMAKMLNFGAVYELLSREQFARRLGPELTADLFPDSSWRDHPPSGTAQPTDLSQPAPPRTRRRASISSEHDTPETEIRGSLPASHADSSLTPGSNNWVLDGSRTESGKPLLANDVHLPHQLPNLWYVAHLQCQACVAAPEGSPEKDMNVAGATLPGVPWVIIGHNQRIAWGFTNLGPTVTDLYVETFNSAGQYQTPTGWTAPEKRHESIRVKGKPDVSLEVVVTRHGPIISELIQGENRSLALRWTLYDTTSAAIPFFDLNLAKDWSEFRLALTHFSGPSQNVVYADVDGNIGYQATGLIPVRAASSNSKNANDEPVPDVILSPFSGADSTHEWAGYIPFDELPSVYAPRSGVLATANSRVVPRSYPYVLTHAWASPYRIERIYRLLNSGEKFRASEMLALQTDVYSEFDRFCAERFVYAVDAQPDASPRAREAASIMRRWDGQVLADSPAPLLVASARNHMKRLLLEPRLGGEWQSYRWPLESVALESMLLHRPPRWLPPHYDSWETLLAAAVEHAASKAPGELAPLSWGESIRFRPQHPVYSRIPLLGRLLGRWTEPEPFDQRGNAFTVLQVGPNFGPSLRMTIDLADLDGSTINLVNGQSGNIFSPHFNNQWTAWRTGTSFPLAFSDSAVRKAAVHELQLLPHTNGSDAPP
ncbi:MAG: penicillin acylase family protein [Candidatus Korobacteraceae bacterium]